MHRFDSIWEAAQETNRTAWLAYGAWFEFSQELRDQFMEQLHQATNTLTHLNQITAEKLRRFALEYDKYLLGADHAEELLLHRERCTEQLERGIPLTWDVHENVGPLVYVEGDGVKISEIFGFVMEELYDILSSRELDFYLLSASVDWLIHPLNGLRRDIQFHPGGSLGGYFKVQPDEVSDVEADECEARFGEIFPERELPASITNIFGRALEGCRRDDGELHQCVSRFNRDLHAKARNLSQNPPRWDRELRELSLDGTMVASWRGRARGGSQFAVMNELETLGWPPQLPVPFELGLGGRRANDAVYRLNEKLRQQDDCRLVFHVTDKDEIRNRAQISWEVARSLNPR